ncbi:hypothetical protein ACRRTK_009850 [Alexandromys fortis]
MFTNTQHTYTHPQKPEGPSDVPRRILAFCYSRSFRHHQVWLYLGDSYVTFQSEHTSSPPNSTPPLPRGSA